MKVTLNFKDSTCFVQKEEGDPTFHDSGWSSAESIFLHHVKKELIKMGCDVIKKRMWKDGCMVDDSQQYVRARNFDFMIYNSRYAIYDAGLHFNETGMIILNLE